MNEFGSTAGGPSQVAVRAFELDAVDQDLAVLLDAAEARRAATFTAAATRRDFMAGRVVQRLMAAELLGAAPQELLAAYSCPDCGPNPVRSHGRPRYWLRGGPAALSISFSRSRGWALAAMVPVAGLPLGVDLQDVAQLGFAGFDDVALSPAEKLRLPGLAPGARNAWRAAAWARKEALAKHSGLGLRTDPTTIEAFADTTTTDTAVLVWDVAPNEVGLPDGFAAAVALGRPGV
ncbi:4'-phosphopantetheinyl transferase family protein [Arthrobacter sp. TMN-49]